MGASMAWVRNLQLEPGDDVFAGDEAAQMEALLGIAERVNGGVAPLTSLKNQAELFRRLEARGRVQEAFAVARSSGLSDFGPCGRAVLAAATLYDVAACFMRFAPLLNLRHAVWLITGADGATLALTPHSHVCAAASHTLRPLDVVKVRRYLHDLARHHGLPCPSTYESDAAQAETGTITLPREFLSPLPKANATDFRRFEREAKKKMRGLEHARLDETVRRILLAGDSEGLPDLAKVASQLGYSQRTFRRRLNERCTSFMHCVNSVRQQLAVRYVVTTDLTVEAIAERLGYSDTANFRHAFRRWTGASPRAYMARALEDLPVTAMRTHRSASPRSVGDRKTPDATIPPEARAL